MKKLVSLFLALGLAVLLAPSVSAQPIWTAVANTGAMDETAAGIFAFITDGPGSPAGLTFRPGSTSLGPVIARYNVTNPDEVNLVLPWTQLELGFTDTGATMLVTATLMRVNACNGVAVPICTVASFDSAAATCNRCNFAAGSVNFGANLYYVEVRLTRTVAAANPIAHTLRIF